MLLQDLLEQNEYLEKHVKKLKKQLKAAYKRVTQSQHESSKCLNTSSQQLHIQNQYQNRNLLNLLSPIIILSFQWCYTVLVKVFVRQKKVKYQIIIILWMINFTCLVVFPVVASFS